MQRSAWKTLSLCFWISFCIPAFANPNASGVGTLTLVKQNSKPKYFDSNNVRLCGEVYSLLANKGMKVEVIPTVFPIKLILTMLEDGRANVFCGAGRNADRELRFIYSSLPVYSVSNVVSARNNTDYNIDSIADIASKDLTVAALFGTSSAKWLKGHDGLRISDQYHSPEEALDVVVSNEKIDIFYDHDHDHDLNYLTRTTYTSLKVLPVKFRTVPQWLIYSKNTSPDLIQMLETELATISSSEALKRIQEKYL